MKTLKGTLLIFMATISLFSSAQFQEPRAGFLSQLHDVGAPSIPGEITYSEPAQEYILSGSGKNIWFAEDNFSFLWKKMEGDFILQAQMEFLGAGTDPHRKAGLMIRNGLSSDAAHVSCVVHGDGLTALQYREKAGENMAEIKFEASGAQVIQLEKKGNTFTMSVAHFGELYEKQSLEISLEGGLHESLHAGLFICAHNDTVTEKAKFSNVRIFGTAPDNLVPYEEYLGSLLEVMDVHSGQRQYLAGAPGSWQAPNWTPDGRTLIYNADGLLYNFDLFSRSSEQLPTDFATQNNNDHVISFGGTQLAISHHPEEDNGRSVIYTLPLEGGTPKRVTPLSPSYLHGWSTDDKYLVYTGGRDGEYNIYKIPVEGGEEIQLTHLSTLDDGPEFSPDGKYIYFNSARTGTMQVWRMDTDGGNQTQITFDEYQDWFPHVSPDNKWIVFISYPPEVPAADHPFYKRVYLRLMSVEEQKPKVIGYLYGGQGTINVPSWSPDSKKIAFVSNGIFN
jgi:Tol biopolymer transport system component